MKKIAILVCAILTLCFSLSFASCTTWENGIKIKYATVTLSYPDDNGKVQTEDIVIKLYTNYAPETVDRFVQNAKGGLYNGTIVNTVESGWFSLGGNKLNGNVLETVTSGKGPLKGEFYDNSVQGNTLSVSSGAVIMYREFTNELDKSNYDTADMKFAICTGGSTPFNKNSYCVFGQVVEGDLTKITALQYRSASDSSDEDAENDYNYYYMGGIAELAAIIEADEELADKADADYDVTPEDYDDVAADGDLYYEPGYMDDEDYNEFIVTARKFINTIGSNEAAYFYKMPYQVVTITSVKITNKI